ncbi:MAG: iron ABC transporter permease [Elusimicrobia bacterium]|nr:iron ABC transporter permease [Elusimicrobiota bacterium]
MADYKEKMKKNRFFRILVLAASLIAAVSIISLLLPLFSNLTETILKLRIMRISVAVIAGCSLAVAGVIFQMVFSNPLADPYLLGNSSGAAFGVAGLAILGISKSGVFHPLAAGFFSCLTAAAVLKIGRTRFGRNSLILTGVAVNFFLSAIVIFVVTLKRKEAYSILYFMMGDLGETRTKLILVCGIISATFIILAFLKSRTLNAISFGKSLSRQLGVQSEKESEKLLMIASVLTGSAVAVGGIIGFVGLMSPHIARKLFSSDARLLIPASMGIGAGILVFSDFAARSILYPVEIPVGVITAILGAPFFIWLYGKKQNNRV